MKHKSPFSNKKSLCQAALPVWAVLILAFSICLCGCTSSPATDTQSGTAQVPAQEQDSSGQGPAKPQETDSSSDVGSAAPEEFDLSTIPNYNGDPYVVVHQNVPFFSEEERQHLAGESYGNLDALGRCTTCYAIVSADTMPDGSRGNIGDIRPSGWHTEKYEGIDGNYLYNRCHLIGWQLTGQNDNPKNLITGTRYMNVEGMEPFESSIASYVRDTGDSVLYRVTPIFEGDNLLASGVLLEALGQGSGSKKTPLKFCVYCYNVQPSVTIDYATGASTGPAFIGSEQIDQEVISDGNQNTTRQAANANQDESDSKAEADVQDVTYIGNANTHKFHLPSCSSVDDMAEHNKVYFDGTRDDVIAAGFDPCGRCKP